MPTPCLACAGPSLERTDWCAPHGGTVRAMKLTVLTQDWLTLRKAHNLEGWGLRFDPARAWLGRTYHAHRTILLARPWVAVRPLEASREALRHEIAHALVGPGHGHDGEWLAQAKAIGSLGLQRATLDPALLPSLSLPRTLTGAAA